MGLARRGREERRRRCRDIGDDERQRDYPQPPSARRVGAGQAHLFVAPPRRCLWHRLVVAPRSGLSRAPNKRYRIYESEYLIQATQKFDYRLQFPLRGPVEFGHELLLALKSGNNLVIGDGNRVGKLPLKPLRGAISVGLLSKIGADFPRQIQAPRLQGMAQTTFVIPDHALGQLFI